MKPLEPPNLARDFQEFIQRGQPYQLKRHLIAQKDELTRRKIAEKIARAFLELLLEGA